ncbi:winged helix-turn-helix domain-containing protein [Streptomyces sp. NPDC006459]|uniref:winged helix-turn-helix domain-containing protein n=1 Tax=Streptomyces sp. NPDC006459 TaxID=3154303 RepID=UPI0033A213E0
MNEKIADDLQRDIETGKYEPGTKLPAVRTIAERFGVAPGTATKALQLLAQRGVVRPDSTRGYFVRAQSERQAQAEPSAEFTAIMQQIEMIRAHLTRLDERLQAVEQTRRSD